MTSPSNPPTTLEVFLANYSASLDSLDSSNLTLTKEQALEILAARDVLQKHLEAQTEIPVQMWSKLIAQDKRLKQNTYKITQVLDLAEYRETLPISDKAWWWNLENRESLHPWNRFDWLLRMLKLILLGVNFTLIGTIATKFLSGGSGLVEIGGFIVSTFIALLQTQNALTQARNKGFVKLMNVFKIREHWYEEIQFGSTVAIFFILLNIWLNFPYFSKLYTEQGKQLQSPAAESQSLPNFALAEQKYLKAIELDSDNLDAHYKLATLYEDLQDFDSAKKQYLIAAKGGYLDAYNNLSYWYIRENKNAEAIALLEKGKIILAENDKKIEQLIKDEKSNLQVQKYNIYKNLGWARFKQNRNEDAIPNLLIAIDIAKNPDYQRYIRNPGAAYCIYAQVLQKHNQKAEAKQLWQQCRQLLELRPSQNRNIEETQWLYESEKDLE